MSTTTVTPNVTTELDADELATISDPERPLDDVRWDGYWTLIGVLVVDVRSGTAADELLAIAAIEETLPAKKLHAIGRARREGMTWQEIGNLLGITRQAAHMAYTRGNPDQATH